MRVLIPMSGLGERFQRAGYIMPKPLIVVEGEPMIDHVASLFGEKPSLDFICNERHLSNADFGMREKLKKIEGSVTIHPIPEHKLGPVHAVLEICEALDPDEAVIVNYADFCCLWSYQDFLDYVSQKNLDGCVPAYRGFHPHSGGTTNYAYIREEDGELIEIREKQPFTEVKTKEFASTGTYYFKSVKVMQAYFLEMMSQNLSVKGEYYVSTAFDLMAKDGLKVGVYEVTHFMQWGTPEDLEEYVFWSDTFKKLSPGNKLGGVIQGSGNLAVLASGRGSRFSDAGYQIPKPFLSVSGDWMLNHNLGLCEPSAKRAVSVTRDSVCYAEGLREVDVVSVGEVTAGQAESASKLLEELRGWEDSAFTVLPSDTLFSDSTSSLARIRDELSGDPFMVIWACSASPYALKNPNSFGWVAIDGLGVKTFIKTPPSMEGAKVISGAFTFSSKQDFSVLFDTLKKKQLKINGEFYLDSTISIAKELGFKIKIFEPEFCLSLGTPYEFETFRYWQTAFDQWGRHTYRLEDDPFVRPENIVKLRKELRSTRHQPSEWFSN